MKIKSWLDHTFKLQANQTCARTEILAGFSSYLTVLYILILIPQIFGSVGMPADMVFVAICVASAFGSIALGVVTNLPLVLAPGIALVVYFAYYAITDAQIPWPQLLAIVAISGIFLGLLAIFGFAQKLIAGIPSNLRKAMIVGLALMLALVGLMHLGAIVPKTATIFGLGQLDDPNFILGFIGLILIFVLEHYKIPGHILIVIALMTFGGTLWGFESPVAAESLSHQKLYFGAWDWAIQWNSAAIGVLLSLLIVDLLNASIATHAILQHLPVPQNKSSISKLRKVLMCQGAATVVSGGMGASTTCPYLESLAGVKAGGRTGLTSVVVGLLFLLSVFLSDVIHQIPIYATAPVLLYLATNMFRQIATMKWNSLADYAPAFVMIVMIPLTFSLSAGIGVGILLYVSFQIVSGHIQKLKVATLLLAVLFFIKLFFFE